MTSPEHSGTDAAASSPGRLRRLIGPLVFVAVYVATAKLGLSMDAVGGFATLVWPPTGLAIAALLVFGVRLWPAVAVAAFLVNFSGGAPWLPAGGMALGNALEAVVAASLLRRRGFEPSFARLQDVFGYVLVAALLSTAISATIGVASLRLGGLIEASAVRSAWSAWWFGDMLGALVVAPLLLVWHRNRTLAARFDGKRLAETAAFALLLAGISVTVVNFSPTALLRPYLAFPLLIWVALRFGIRGTVTATFGITALAIWVTAQGVGPFVATDLSDGLKTLHFFLGSLAVTGLTLASAIAERVRAESDATESRATLTAERRIRSIVQSAHDAFIAIDHTGAITDWNSQAEATFGWTAAEAIGRQLAETIIPESHREAHARGLARFLATGEGRVLGKRLELPALHRSGRHVPVEMTITPLRHGSEHVFSAFLRDVSDRKRAEQLQSIQLAATRIIAEAGMGPDVYTRYLETLCKGLGWDYGAIWVVNAAGDRLVPREVWRRDVPELREFERASRELALARGEGLPGRVWDSQAAVWTVDAMTDEEFARRPQARAAGLRGAVIFPIEANDACVGVVEFFSHERQEADPKLLETMTDIGTRLGFYILRRDAVEQQRLSEERYRQIVDAVQDYAIFALDPDGNVASWNAGAERIIGYGASEVLGRHFSMFYAPEDQGGSPERHELETARAAGRFETEGVRVRKDGTRLWANVVITPIFDQVGKLVGYSKVTRDITEKKAADERERRINELEFRSVFDHASAGAAQADPSTGRLLRVNPKYCEITGYDADELRGLSFMDLTHPDDREDTRERFAQLVAGETQEFFAEKRYVRKNRAIIWVQVTVTMIRDAEGAPIRAVAIIQDVTERRVADAEQRFLADASKILASLDYQSSLSNLAQLTVPKLADWCSIDILDETGDVKRLAIAHANLNDLRSVQDMDRRFQAAPRSSAEVIKSGQPELHSEVTDAVLVAAAHDAQHLELLRSIGMKSAMIVPLEHRGKVLGALSMVTAASGRRYGQRDLAFALEVGRRAAMAIENARLYAESVTSNRLKDEFLATLSHELRTPLNSILGWAELLRSGGIEPDEVAEALETIHRNAHTQSQLINDLLDVSRIITGKLRIEPRPVDIQSVVANAVASVRLSAQAKGVRLHLTSDAGVGTIQGDTDRLQQIFWNLLTNALRFTPPDGTISLSLRTAGPCVEIVVADSGEGIDPAFLPHVFDRFRQEDSSRTRRHGGLGLGLAIVRHIAEAHGGTVRAASPGHGQGATFTVSLPVVQAVRSTDRRPASAVEAGPSEARPTTPRTLGLAGLKILVIDDDEGSRRMVRRILMNHGAGVLEAGSAAEALAVAPVYLPHVIVSDIGMPQVDGYELMRRIRARPEAELAQVPSIALTAYARDEERQQAIDAGFQDHISKPVRSAQLVTCVARVAGRSGKNPTGEGNFP